MKLNTKCQLTNTKVEAEGIIMVLKLFLNSNDMDDIYENMEEYNPNKERKILILFDDLIVEMLIHKKTSTNSN